MSGPGQYTALLRRIKELLLQQQDCFHRYLNVLEKQQTIIKNNNADSLIAHVELEEQLIAEIISIQNVIDPLKKMYQAHTFGTADEVSALENTVTDLKNQASALSVRNRELLFTHMAELRVEMSSLKNNPFKNISHSMYRSPIAASLVDISG